MKDQVCCYVIGKTITHAHLCFYNFYVCSLLSSVRFTLLQMIKWPLTRWIYSFVGQGFHGVRWGKRQSLSFHCFCLFFVHNVIKRMKEYRRSWTNLDSILLKSILGIPYFSHLTILHRTEKKQKFQNSMPTEKMNLANCICFLVECILMSSWNRSGWQSSIFISRQVAISIHWKGASSVMLFKSPSNEKAPSSHSLPSTSRFFQVDMVSVSPWNDIQISRISVTKWLNAGRPRNLPALEKTLPGLLGVVHCMYILEQVILQSDINSLQIACLNKISSRVRWLAAVYTILFVIMSVQCEIVCKEYLIALPRKKERYIFECIFFDIGML